MYNKKRDPIVNKIHLGPVIFIMKLFRIEFILPPVDTTDDFAKTDNGSGSKPRFKRKIENAHMSIAIKPNENKAAFL